MWLSMVRAAQQAGDISSLYPPGCDRISDIPWFLETAIEHALTVLNWMENLPKKEVPPKHIWADVDGLELWWKKLEDLRGDPSVAASSASVEESAGTENEAARAFRDGR